MLQQDDVNELRTTLVTAQDTDTAKGSLIDEVKVYDFACPDNIPSEFFQVLETINSTFARNLSSMFSSYLSEGAQVALHSVDTLSVRQFCDAAPEISAFCTFAFPPLDGLALCEFNPQLAWYLLDRALGGPGEIIDAPRVFTPLTTGLLEDIFRRILRELGRSWELLVPLQSQLREVISNPAMAHLGQPEDRMLVSSFSITMSEVTGMYMYCIPIYSLDFESLLNQDSETHIMKIDPATEKRLVITNLLLAPVQVRACFPEIPLSLQELSALRVDDVISFDLSPDDPIIVKIGNTPRFQGRPATLEDKVAIDILHEITEDDHD